VNERTVETRRGITVRVREAGKGTPLLYLHGAGGLLPTEPTLEKLAERYHVIAPVWPGYGDEEGEELLEDMLDFALHGWDVVEALGVERPLLLGHSMGGMIAAEMACLAPGNLSKLVLVAPAGLWIDEHPLPDLFAMLPFELAPMLFHDAEAGVKLLTGGVDFSDMDALQDFMVGNARRLGTAGKILFPIPNRRLSKRLYRLSTPTLLVWGREDRFIPPLYAQRWLDSLPSGELAWIDGCGHMAPYEQPEAVADAIAKFLG
jgi:pimeloyl-ACP methyl ester carboxylesterase